MRNLIEEASYKGNSFQILLTVFIASLIIAQFLAAKLCSIQITDSYALVFPGGVIAYALTFLCTDVISEIWGRKTASKVILQGLIANLVILGLIQITRILPDLPGWELSASFYAIADSITRVTFASMAAYLVSQYHDIWMFHLMKKVTHKKHLWLRNIVSTTISQALDTIVFIIIAFWGHLGVSILTSMMIGQFLIKLAIALFDTPFVYLIVWKLRKDKKYKIERVENSCAI